MGAHFSATMTANVHATVSGNSCFVKFNWKHFVVVFIGAEERRTWVRAHNANATQRDQSQSQTQLYICLVWV